jgi:hypothetical protein
LVLADRAHEVCCLFRLVVWIVDLISRQSRFGRPSKKPHVCEQAVDALFGVQVRLCQRGSKRSAATPANAAASSTCMSSGVGFTRRRNGLVLGAAPTT